ncbi:ribosome biogenesis GTP-binding protein YihA/YsxC [Litorimonas sp. WD9-15]|uniref:ribosome biogenesis GTP-binding protein YihA/YsxC n=1 Tax=Litorimonas sp. WD9-15 TaxID=3418716 RepID=UPI003D068462
MSERENTPAPSSAPLASAPDFTKAQIEEGRLLFARDVDFMLSVVNLESLPPANRPEICFAGRSNVGKSSLINALTNRKGLARASNTPGRTRELNYFNVHDRLNLVDLPGYGYAKASKSDIKNWTQLTRAFLRGRAGLRRVFLLVDSRHGVKDSDLELMSMLDETAVTYQVVLTKVDKKKSVDLDKTMRKTSRIIAKRPAAHPILMVTSSEKKTGLDMLRAEIATLALPAN